MDGFTQIEARNDEHDRWRIGDAVAAATTWQEVEEIQAQCEHRYHVGKSECWICGYVKPADPDFLIDDIPYLGMR